MQIDRIFVNIIIPIIIIFMFVVFFISYVGAKEGLKFW
jgi:amino acid transporter